jgi:hypothetical protein
LIESWENDEEITELIEGNGVGDLCSKHPDSIIHSEIEIEHSEDGSLKFMPDSERNVELKESNHELLS